PVPARRSSSAAAGSPRRPARRHAHSPHPQRRGKRQPPALRGNRLEPMPRQPLLFSIPLQMACIVDRMSPICQPDYSTRTPRGEGQLARLTFSHTIHSQRAELPPLLCEVPTMAESPLIDRLRSRAESITDTRIMLIVLAFIAGGLFVSLVAAALAAIGDAAQRWEWLAPVDAAFRWLDGFAQNFSTEMIGAAITFILLE